MNLIWELLAKILWAVLCKENRLHVYDVPSALKICESVISRQLLWIYMDVTEVRIWSIILNYGHYITERINTWERRDAEEGKKNHKSSRNIDRINLNKFDKKRRSNMNKMFQMLTKRVHISFWGHVKFKELRTRDYV